MPNLLIACVVGTAAFVVYTQTLLPGVDLGDTGGFQAAVLWPDVSARQAYPLYYNLARPFVLATAPANPARALNLFSAVTAAFAVGLLAALTALVTRSLAGGAAAGLLLAFSYTFWTQAIIAEVYGLHLALIGACLLALCTYDRVPTRARLLAFLATYAIAFGNHLGMILLFVPFTAFLLRDADRRARLLTPAVMGLATAIAAAAALQYLPNLLAAWVAAPPDSSAIDRLAAFWVDTTKADWRESMVLGVRADQAADRLGMWWFDMRQQFGIAGIAAAAAGAVALWRRARAWTGLLLGIFAVTTMFAITYNVGDSHVFFLPAHYVMALFAGAVVASAASWGGPHQVRRASLTRLASLALVVAAFVYVGWRAWDTWPAVDRHEDYRTEQFVARLTLGLADRETLLVSGMNWQLDNALLYTARHDRRDIAWTRIGDVLPHFQLLVQDNHRIGRDVVVTAEAAAEIAAAYGTRFAMLEEPSVAAQGLSEIGAVVAEGTPYVMAVLTPPRDEALDPDVLADAIAALTGGRTPARTPGSYEVMAGLAGQAPSYYRSSGRPFRDSFIIVDEPFTVRMESWLPFDTFRRAGFGHVLHRRDRALILERGVNLVWLERNGSPAAPLYAASLFAPKPRFRLPVATLGLAHLRPSGYGQARRHSDVGIKLER